LAKRKRKESWPKEKEGKNWKKEEEIRNKIRKLGVRP